MLDGYLDSRLRVNSFHGVSARHIPEYALQSPVGEVRRHHIILRMGRIILQPLEGVSFRFVWVNIATTRHDRGALLEPFPLRFRDPHQAAARTLDKPADRTLAVE